MTSRYSDAKLLFRRQFVLGPTFPTAFRDWERIKIRKGLCLAAHPDLGVTSAVAGVRSVTLLGYALDCRDSSASDRDIATILLARFGKDSNPDSAFSWTADLGGRWVLVFDDPTATTVFSDAMGLRQVFYTSSQSAGTWCASQPALLAEVLELERDPVAVSTFADPAVCMGWQERVWPGDRCAYSGVRHLLPNHSLDLATGLRRREWPDSPLLRVEFDEAVEEVASMLTNLLEGAADRFPLALATTAGWDTRLILAACRPIQHRLRCFTLKRGDGFVDWSVAPRLLANLGLAHEMIEIPCQMDPGFERIYKRNVTDAHDFWGLMAQALFEEYPSGRVCVTGNAAEITRASYILEKGQTLTPELLARLTSSAFRFQDELEGIDYVVEAWREWLSESGDFHGVPPLDLFVWEHEGGNFAAMGESEWDIVHESFTPFDCRRLLTTMLGVDEKRREYDRPELYRAVIRRLWPELLREPVNAPHEGSLGPALRTFRFIGLNRLIPSSWKQLARRAMGLAARDTP